MNTSAVADYRDFLAEIGFNDSDVRKASEKSTDRIDIDTNVIYLCESDIEGIGIFSSTGIDKGDIVMAALLGGMRTQAGRYTNHSGSPNASMQYIGEDIYLVAISDIPKGEELTTNYRDTRQLLAAKTHLTKPGILRQSISDLERRMKTDLIQHQIEPDIKHFFSDGMYGREMTLNSGDFIVGKIHKTAHIVVVSKGSGYIATEHGITRYKAPWTFVSQPGTKRAIKAEEDTVWLTLHATKETDLKKIEAEVIAKDYESLGGVV